MAHGVQHLSLRRALLVEGAREVLSVEEAAVADLHHRRAVAGHLLEDPLDERRAPIGDELGHLVRAAEDLLLQLRNCVSAERHEARYHKVEQHAERPDVHVHAVVALVFEQLRRRVRRRAAERVQRLRGACRRAEPEVAHLHDARRREVEVLRLQVPVDDVLRVLRAHTTVDLFTHQSQMCTQQRNSLNQETPRNN